MEMNFEGLKMRKWNVPADRVPIVDEKNGVICLVIIFTEEGLSDVIQCFTQAVLIFCSC